MPDGISVVPIGNKVCKPFVLEVMVFAPESGFKFKVLVERSCTPDADPLWKLVFDLFEVKTQGGEVKETQIVHVSYTTKTPVEAKNVQNMAAEGVKPKQAEVLIKKVHPAAKAVAGKSKPTQKQKEKLKESMEEVTNLSF